MLLRAYTLHDSKALTYSPPFFQHNDALAIRMLTDLVADTNTAPGRHPADFRMYCVGTYDDLTGSFTPHNIIEHVMDAISVLPPSPADMFTRQRKE